MKRQRNVRACSDQRLDPFGNGYSDWLLDVDFANIVSAWTHLDY